MPGGIARGRLRLLGAEAWSREFGHPSEHSEYVLRYPDTYSRVNFRAIQSWYVLVTEYAAV